MTDKTRVIVADDTATFRMILKSIIDSFETCKCIATAQNGRIAVRKVKDEKPDLVILDVEMPELDGPNALREIRKFDPDVPVVIVSGYNMENARKVISALENGALDFITKPEAKDPEESTRILKTKLKPLIDMVEVRKIVRKARADAAPSPPTKKTIPPPSTAPPVKEEVIPVMVKKRSPGILTRSIELVLIASSTGGPNALKEVLSKLPENLRCPVLIVQHMPPMFTRSLAESLDKLSPMKIFEASEGDIPEPGAIYLAPGGLHMMLRKKFIGKTVKHELHMVDTPPVNSCRPAADVLFKSVARVLDGTVLAVVLTGMGRDGTDGVEALKKKNLHCLVQDEETSVVWGMPQEVYNRGLADEVIPLEQIAPRITQIVNKQF
jgi:two-component system, chemotaxis family, protein-glutamate methylesterase/glutaminase